MNRLPLRLGLALLIGSGCTPVAQPAPTVTASPTPAMSVASPVASSPAATRPPSSEESGIGGVQALGRVRHYELPKDPQGQWVTTAALEADAVVVALLPGTPPSDEERRRFRMLLGRLDLRTGAVATLVELDPGTTMYGTAVAGRMIAWVETSPIDLRALGWKLHLTDAVSGADRVVLTDPGIHPDGLDSVIPVFDYDGSSILYTVLSRRQDGVAWELRRLKDGREQIIAELADIRDRRFMAIERDDRSIVWLEDVMRPSPHTVIGIYDLNSGAVTRRTTTVRAGTLALTPERIFLGTDLGVAETDRVASYEPKRSGPAGLPAEQLAVVGAYLLYGRFDGAQSLVARDLGSGAETVLATGVTSGPSVANGVVQWYERTKGSTPARVVILSP